MATLEIHAAEPQDIPAILSLLRELAEYERKPGDVRVDERLLAAALFSERRCAEALLAKLDGTPAAYALFFPHFASFLGLPWLYLEDLYVRPVARRHGVGRAMMAKLAGITLERGWAGMAWGVLDWNKPAFAFYHRLGAVNSNGHVYMELSGEPLERLAASR
jgi:GNAT superfamily N-acetyltransferase